MIQMTGGMGNQMFYYALYKALQSRGKDVCIEDFTHYCDIGRYDNNLEQIFPGVSYEHATLKDYNALTDSSMRFQDRLRRKLFGRKEIVHHEKDAITYEEAVFEKETGYYIGYWQSSKYFAEVTAAIRRDFQFPWERFPEKVLRLKQRIQEGVSISIHVRRGDYLETKFAPIYGGICTSEYYESAMEYFEEKCPGCEFFLFTNDLEWGRTIKKDNVFLVEECQEEPAYIDMALMSCCKHNIIANSSFSWWGAWLNENVEKIVIAPAKWFNNSSGEDIYDKMIKVRIDAHGVLIQDTREA